MPYHHVEGFQNFDEKVKDIPELLELAEFS
jgi:hypothetical protein